MNSKLFPLYLFIVFGCNSTKDIPGKYRSQRINHFFPTITKQARMIGVSLILFEDSTYVWQNCAIISKGIWQWQLSSSRIALICKSKSYLIDSFNYKSEFNRKINCDLDTSYYYLKQNKLLRSTIINNKKIAIRLVKEN